METEENKLDPATELAITRLVERKIQEIGVHREDFTELKDAVTQMSRNMDQLSKNVDQLSKNMDQLSKNVDRLSEAQTRTEKRVEELAHAQARTEKRVEELAHAQARTERTVRRLSDDLGVGMEDLGGSLLPGFLLREHKIRVKSLENRELEIDGHSFEIDLFGRGKIGKEPVLVLVEVKTRATKSDVSKFDRRLKKIRKLVPERVAPVMFGMRMTREARDLAGERGMVPISGNQV